MAFEYDGDHLVEFQHTANSPLEETTEGIEFFQIVDKHLSILFAQPMVRFEHIEVFVELEFSRVFWRLIELLVYFFYYLIRNHTSDVFQWLPHMP